MTEAVKEDVIGEIEDLLNKLELKEEHFQKKERTPGVKAPAHDIVVDKIYKYWDEKHPYISEYSEYGIDMVGREMSQGPIKLAVEVDAGWWRIRPSFMKLADIRATNKIWIHISDSTTARKDFDKALNEIDKLIRIRKETKETFENFAIFLKTPNPKVFKMKRIF